MANTTSTLKVGDEAPDFELRGTGGATFKLSDHRGKKNVVLHFFPAAFSTVCANQLPTVQQEKSNFAAADTEVAGISVDNAWSLGAFAKQLGIDYPLLADFFPQGAVAQKYGVFLDKAGVSGRAIIVIDKQGKVRHIDVTPTPVEIPDEAAALACARSL